MTHNDILRRVRYAFDLNDPKMVEVFAHSGQAVTLDQVRAWMGREGEEGTVPIAHAELGGFLDGLVIERRGPRDPELPAPEPERVLTNNAIFKKLRIALELREPEVLAILEAGGHALSKHELSALFRKPKHKHYRNCGDQVLRAFLRGMTLKLRPGVALPE